MNTLTRAYTPTPLESDMRACLVTLLALTACTGADPELADPPSLPTPPTPDDTGDTGPDPAWVEAIIPPTDVTAACWSWSVTWDQFDEPRSVTRQTLDRTTLTPLTYAADFADESPDGSWDALADYTWDPTYELLTRAVYDDDGDGVTDEILEVEYDANGDRTLWRNDTDADGDFDDVWTYVHVDRVRVSAERDEDGDGQVDVWWTYINDAQGRPLAIQGDRGNDGSVDHRIDYAHDDTLVEGRAFTRYEDMDLDGVPEVREYDRYDALDRLVAEEWEVPTARMEATNTYNQDGDRIAREQRYWFDGEFNDLQQTTWTYEAPGREVREDLDITFGEVGPPQISEHTDTTWFCP